MHAGTSQPQARWRVATQLEYLTRTIGLTLAWLTLLMALAMAAVVVQRYFLGMGSIRLQESIGFMHAAVFLLAAAYTLADGDHVRVDIFYAAMSPRRKAWVDMAGTLLLLLPFCVFLLVSSWDYVATSWAIAESSGESGGLPHPFPAIMKSFIPAAGLLLALQGVVMLLDATQMLTGGSRETEAS